MHNFLLEVGTEELPAFFVSSAIAQWRQLIPESLQEHSLTPTEIKVYGTPRRISVLITGLPSQQPDREEEIKGPSAQAAYKDGQPTKAVEGFARKQGVELAALSIRATDKGDFVFVRQKFPGRPVAEILTELVQKWIGRLDGKRFMRWGDGDLKFSRPIRTIVALWDEALLPIELVNGSEIIKSDRYSHGHRVLHPELVKINHASDYVTTLRSAFVEVDADERATRIKEQVQAAVQYLEGHVEIYPDLLAEVTNLVEWPTAVVGKFESEFLDLPKEVITTVMVSHQRYFPVFQADAPELMPNFVTVSNGDPAKSDLIAVGNERVIRARLADGQFFYKADLAKALESFLPQLEKVTFQEDLGSLREKVDRICQISSKIADQLQLDAETRHNVQRTALLCKADLVSQMVYEFPELQGVMGQKYAMAGGENTAVATGIIEHYLPKSADDILPTSLTGQVVGLADRLDTLVGIFGLGLLPTGSSDPFALRRAANAVINITWTAHLAIDLQQLLEQATADFVAKHPQEPAKLVTLLPEFFIQRIQSLLQERQIDYDLVNAVLGENDPEYTQRALQNLLDVRDRALFLQSIRNNGTLAKIYETVNRATRLAAQGDLDRVQLDPTTVVRPELFQKPSEPAFYEALVQLMPQTQAAQQSRNYQQFVTALSAIAPTLNNFFDGPESVLVMDSDPQIKQNRLNLLGILRNHARILGDFGAIVKN